MRSCLAFRVIFMRVTLILEFPASYCYLARGIAQVYLLYFLNNKLTIICGVSCKLLLHLPGGSRKFTCCIFLQWQNRHEVTTFYVMSWGMPGAVRPLYVAEDTEDVWYLKVCKNNCCENNLVNAVCLIKIHLLEWCHFLRL